MPSQEALEAAIARLAGEHQIFSANHLFNALYDEKNPEPGLLAACVGVLIDLDRAHKLISTNFSGRQYYRTYWKAGDRPDCCPDTPIRWSEMGLGWSLLLIPGRGFDRHEARVKACPICGKRLTEWG